MEHKKSILLIAGLLTFSFSFIFSSYLIAQEDSECIECHGEKDNPDIPYVNYEEFKTTIHAENGCISCHIDIEEIPHNENLAPVDCSLCHEDASEQYMQSVHGKKHQEGDKVVPYCSDCHSKHNIYPVKDPKSHVSHKNLVKTCAKCHADEKIIKEYNIIFPNVIKSYSESIHAKGINELGLNNSATCSDCHNSHLILKAYKENSSINKKNIAKTCGKCHISIYQQYKKSIHGKAVANDVPDAPSCPDCHGEHLVKELSSKNGEKVAITKGTETCIACHKSEKLNTRYNIPSNRVDSYLSSYHGMATKLGSVRVAKCNSCHGTHNILPSSDPESTIYPANLHNTCGASQCHPGATDNFANGVIHKPQTNIHSNILWWIKWIYILMIIGTIGGMLFHNGLDYAIKFKTYYLKHLKSKGYERFSLSMRVQHFVLLFTFSYLAYSGFALKFPQFVFFYPFKLFGNNAEIIRAFSHRGAAIIFTLACIYHVYFLLITKRGKRELKDMFPTFKDLTDTLGMMMYYLGFSKSKPLFKKYTYVEKAEYWALIWGSIVMIATGCMLWFENWIMGSISLPKISIDIAELIHLCEAILATLAIIVWHIFHVVINPEAYPVNLTFLTGKITEDDLKHHHPLEYERIKREEESSSNPNNVNDSNVEGQDNE